MYLTLDGGFSWSEAQILLASDGEPNDQFGNSVASHGNIIVIGSFSDDGVAATSGT